MIVVDERAFSPDEDEFFSISNFYARRPETELNRRNFLFSLANAGLMSTSGMLLVTSSTAQANILGLIRALIIGSINFLKSALTIGETLHANFNLANAQYQDVKGRVVSEVSTLLKYNGKLYQQLRDKKETELIVPPRRVLTLKQNEHKMQSDYKDGNYTYKATTQLNTRDRGFEIVSSAPYQD